MHDKRDDYILGRNVTEQAQSREKGETVVLSFRLSGEEFVTLSEFAESHGRTVSQVAREAIQQWLLDRGRDPRWAAMSFSGGTRVQFGDVSGSTFRAGEPDVEFNLTVEETDVIVVS